MVEFKATDSVLQEIWEQRRATVVGLQRKQAQQINELKREVRLGYAHFGRPSLVLYLRQSTQGRRKTSTQGSLRKGTLHKPGLG